MTSVETIETPAVLVDLDRVERNLAAFELYCVAHNIQQRPHIKTHKMPFLAKLQMEHGAFGVTCQKISEAQAMIGDDGCDDLLITYNIIGDSKTAQLKAVQEKVKKLSVVVDSAFTIEGLARAFSNEKKPLNVLIECNTGADRCGVETKEQALELAQLIASKSGLHFAGLMTYPPAGQNEMVQQWLSGAVSFLKTNGHNVEVVSCGGTPQMWGAHLIPIATEWRAGTYIYNDRSLVERGTCTIDDCALHVLATVVSRPHPNRAIIDAGSKTLTSDLLGMTGYGIIQGYPDITIDQLSEEHGRLVSDKPIDLKVGERVKIIPNHACVVTNMVDYIHFMRGDTFDKTMRVVARGCII